MLPHRQQQKGQYLSARSERSPGAIQPGATQAATSNVAGPLDAATVASLILASLDDDKAEDIVAIDIAGKSSVADKIIVASGRSQRHVGALADHVMEKLKAAGGDARAEGMANADWVLIDAGDVLVHLFRPEVRAFYNIEKIWASPAAKPNAA